MKSRKSLLILLIGGLSLLILGTLWGWHSERGLSPDERLYRSLLRDRDHVTSLNGLAMKMPTSWAKTWFYNRGESFDSRIAKKTDLLIQSGFFTNVTITVAKFPEESHRYEIHSELFHHYRSAGGLTNDDHYFDITDLNTNGKVSFICRPRDLPQYIQALNQPCPGTLSTKHP